MSQKLKSVMNLDMRFVSNDYVNHRNIEKKDYFMGKIQLPNNVDSSLH